MIKKKKKKKQIIILKRKILYPIISKIQKNIDYLKQIEYIQKPNEGKWEK